MDLLQLLDAQVLSRTLSWLPQRQALQLMVLASDWVKLVAAHLRRLATWIYLDILFFLGGKMDMLIYLDLFFFGINGCQWQIRYDKMGCPVGCCLFAPGASFTFTAMG